LLSSAEDCSCQKSLIPNAELAEGNMCWHLSHLSAKTSISVWVRYYTTNWNDWGTSTAASSANNELQQRSWARKSKNQTSPNL